ncbi:MAG: hypothetical protein AAFR17_09940 [Pseudomonadota bacterium]
MLAASVPRLAANAVLLTGFAALAWWHLGLFPAGMHEDDAFFYLQIARNLVETGRVSFDGLNATNGVHPLWTAVLAAGTAAFSTLGLPMEVSLIAAAALPLLGFAAFCPAPVFAALLIACYLMGFGMEGVLGALLFVALAGTADRGWRVALAMVALLLVLCRIDFALVLALIGAWFAATRPRLLMPLLVGSVLGIFANLGANWLMAGEVLSVSATHKAGAAFAQAGWDLVRFNYASPGNLVRLLLYLGALATLVLSERSRGHALTAPWLHLSLAAFLAFHSTVSVLRDWYFAAPALTALAACAYAGPPTRSARRLALPCLLLPLLAIGWQMIRHAEDAAQYHAFLASIPREGPPLFAYDGSGHIAFQLHPRPVINGDGLVNTPEFARRSDDAEWLEDWLTRHEVVGFFTNRGLPQCLTPRLCCPAGSVVPSHQWETGHPLLADRLWMFPGRTICPLRPVVE